MVEKQPIASATGSQQPYAPPCHNCSTRQKSACYPAPWAQPMTAYQWQQARQREHDACVICCDQLQKLQSQVFSQFIRQLAWLPVGPRVATCKPRPIQMVTNHQENRKEPHLHPHQHKQYNILKNQLYSQSLIHIAAILLKQVES